MKTPAKSGLNVKATLRDIRIRTASTWALSVPCKRNHFPTQMGITMLETESARFSKMDEAESGKTG